MELLGAAGAFPKGAGAKVGLCPPVQSPSLCCCGWEVLRWFHEREIQSSQGAIPQIRAVLGAFDVKLMELFVLSVWGFCFQAWHECSSPCPGVPFGSVLSQELKGLFSGCQCKQSLPSLEPMEMCALLIFDCGFEPCESPVCAPRLCVAAEARGKCRSYRWADPLSVCSGSSGSRGCRCTPGFPPVQAVQAGWSSEG